tara:strand:- start:490 stop:1041 length:552 start_codon:yes stop_codon:yes gene_type:complete
MKLLFENWRDYMKTSSPKVVTFDFDDTLTITKPDEDWGVVEVGPNMEMINLMKDFISSGVKVYIVTSRFPSRGIGDSLVPPELQRSTPEEYVEKYQLDIERAPIYTSGELKAKTLHGLGSELHFDDDPEEIQECERHGIKTHKVPVPHWESVGINEQYDMFINNTLTERQFIKKAIRYLFRDD